MPSSAHYVLEKFTYSTDRDSQSHFSSKHFRKMASHSRTHLRGIFYAGEECYHLGWLVDMLLEDTMRH